MIRFFRYFLVLLVLVLTPGWYGVHAQAETPDFEKWRSVAQRAEEAIQTARASETAMDSLRAQLVEWRNDFDTYKSQTRISVETLEAQLDRLGDAPENPENESAEIVEQRDKLNSALSTARVPIVKAELASIEAVKLIEGVDKLMRDRHASELRQRNPSPVFLRNWNAALRSISGSASHVFTEIQSAWTYEQRTQDFFQNMLSFLGLLAIGLVLMFRSSFWTARALKKLRQSKRTATHELVAFLISLGYVIPPLIGIFLVVEAFYATDLVGLRGEQILGVLPLAGFHYLMPVWIGRRVFTKTDTEIQRVPLNPKQVRQALNASYLVGAVMATYQVFEVVASFDGWESDSRSVILFPLFLAAGALMLRFAQLFRANVRANIRATDGEAKYYDHFLSILARFYQIAAVVGVGLAIAGYTRAAEALMFPAIYTVQLVTLLILMHGMFNRMFADDTAPKVETERKLWPLILSCTMVLLSTPLLLLIWGMRPQEITSFYRQILIGIRVGDITISPSQVIIFLAIFTIGYAITRGTQAFLKNTFLPRTRLDIGGQNAVVVGVGYVGLTLAAMIALNNTGIDLGSIALVASALSVGIGFGLQTIVSNFVSGIILLIERPIAEGDWIEVNGQMGYVRDISVRSTRIETFDRTDVIVPNSDLVAGTVTNYTRGSTVGRVIAPIGVAYGTDPRTVEKILLEVANGHPMILATPAPYVVFQGFGASSLDFEIRAILRDVNWVLSVRSDLNYEIARRFVEEGIEIPFPQQDVWLRTPEPAKHPVQVEPVSPAELNTIRQQDNDGGGDAGGDGDR
ncbi:Small-conductance mechanosensitive channel [Shimia gijangensis]|uniref:Small-conductance mechanosensitive channel n=1 Tax=Shimia gijangensis TaxID=1470563 RepID=A0A1M6QW63_9RHOB|nr:mechanosensitive ion channel domain-containing protein [Shimia gijangensis]SHK24328.1 Small-conductance mechanosensitive channel [Shimia gijangensis]